MANQAQSIAEDLMVGAGALYFERDDDPHGLHHLGNCDEFNITTDVTTVEKNSSMNKRRELMASVTTAVKPTATVTLTEYNPYNMALGLYGTENVHKQVGAALNQVAYTVVSVPGVIELKDNDGEPYYDVSDVVIGLSNTQPASFKWKNVGVDYSVDSTNTIITDNHEVEVPAKVAVVDSSVGTAYTIDGLVITDTDSTQGGGTITFGIADSGLAVTTVTDATVEVTTGTTALGDTAGLVIEVKENYGATQTFTATGGSTSETFTTTNGLTIKVDVPSGTGLIVNAPVTVTETPRGTGSAGGTLTLGLGTFSGENDSVYVTVVSGTNDKGDLDGLVLNVLEGALGGTQSFTATAGMKSQTFTLLSGATIKAEVTDDTQIVTNPVMIEAEEIGAVSQYKAGKDYILDEQMLRAGLIQIPAGSRITEGERVLVSATVPNADFVTVSGSSAGEISGRLLFVGDPNIGGRYNIEAYRCKVRPDGDFTGLISSDFGSFNLTIDFLADYENHPDAHYYRATLIGKADGSTKNSGVYNPNY